MIPKTGGGERPLGIPTIRDRVVQAAAKIVLEPIFEADLEASAYGYRPQRSAQDAIRRVHKLVCEGYTDVVDADRSKYFDTIPHCELLQCVAQRIVDGDVLHLIKMWLQAPAEERDENGKRRLTHLVILSRGKAAEALNWTRQVVTRMGVTLNEAKTSIKQARKESFDFLGYTFGPHRYQKDGRWYLGGQPVEEGSGTHQGKGGKPSHTQQHGDLGGGAGPAESDSERLVGVLQLRNPGGGVWGG
jgi:RNA-directed DNA polymerase